MNDFDLEHEKLTIFVGSTQKRPKIFLIIRNLC